MVDLVTNNYILFLVLVLLLVLLLVLRISISISISIYDSPLAYLIKKRIEHGNVYKIKIKRQLDIL
jgi:hypothetical protein